MNDNPLYDLLAKAELHPDRLTHLERAILWLWQNREDSCWENEILDLCKKAAAELEQLQHNSEAERDTVWLGEPVPAPEVTV